MLHQWCHLNSSMMSSPLWDVDTKQQWVHLRLRAETDRGCARILLDINNPIAKHRKWLIILISTAADVLGLSPCPPEWDGLIIMVRRRLIIHVLHTFCSRKADSQSDCCQKSVTLKWAELGSESALCKHQRWTKTTSLRSNSASLTSGIPKDSSSLTIKTTCIIFYTKKERRDSQNLCCWSTMSVCSPSHCCLYHSQVIMLFLFFFFSLVQIRSETQWPDPGRGQTQSAVGSSLRATFHSALPWPASHITTDAGAAQQTPSYTFGPRSSGEDQSKLEKPLLTSVPYYAAGGSAGEMLPQPIERRDASPPSSTETSARKQTCGRREIRESSVTARSSIFCLLNNKKWLSNGAHVPTTLSFVQLSV